MPYLDHLNKTKGFRVKVSKALPRNNEGFDGEIRIIVRDGVWLYFKYGNSWYKASSQSTKISGRSGNNPVVMSGQSGNLATQINSRNNQLEMQNNINLGTNTISPNGREHGITFNRDEDLIFNNDGDFEVFNNNVQYSTGTAYQSGYGIVGSGTTWTNAMVGGRFIFDDGTDSGIITSFALANVLTSNMTQTVGAADDLRPYKIYYPSVQVETASNGTTLRIGNTTFDTVSGDISLSPGGISGSAGDAGGGDIYMSDGVSNIFHFDVKGAIFEIYDDADTDGTRDYFQIAVSSNGATSISTYDDDGEGADCVLNPDGNLVLKTVSNKMIQILPTTKTASSNLDNSIYIYENLNLSSGAGGSDVHYGIFYLQNQSDLTGWDAVYLMYLTAGAGKILHIDNNANLTLSNDRKVVFGDAGEYIVGDGTQLDIVSSLDLDLTSSRDTGIYSGRVILLDAASNINFDSELGIFNFFDAGDTDDAFKITVVGGTGVTTLETVSAGDDGHLILDADGDLTLDSNSGNFIAKKAGTEFSAANSAYAGMILGYTHVFHPTDTNGEYQAVTTAWESLLWDTDKYALVTFVVPPSNKVEIKVHLPFCNLSGHLFKLGLATDNSATTLGTKYENKVWDVDETDLIGINYSWVVDGSDHSWAAGETKTLYIMAYAGGGVRIYNSGNNSGYHGGVKVQAIALPATIGDGSEP